MESVKRRGRTGRSLTPKEEGLNASHHAGVAHHGRGRLAREAGLAPRAPVDREAVEVVEEEGRVAAVGVAVDAAEHKHVLAGKHGAVPAAGAGKSTGHGRRVPSTETGKVEHEEGARRLFGVGAVATVDVNLGVLKK